MSTYRWINKTVCMWNINMKKTEIMPFAATWMDHTKRSKSDKDIVYMWNLKKKK